MSPRSFAIYFAIALALASPLTSSAYAPMCTAFPSSPKPTEWDVRQTIQASLLRLLGDLPAFDQSWGKGNVIVLCKHTSISYLRRVVDAAEAAFSWGDDPTMSKGAKNKLLNLISREKEGAAPAALPAYDLSNVKFDPHIVLGKQFPIWFGRFDEPIPKRIGGKLASVRFYLRVETPVFTSDGKYAVVGTTLPTSHGTAATIFLEKVGTHWRVFHIHYLSYL